MSQKGWLNHPPQDGNGVVSVMNSTTTTIVADGNFTGGWEDISAYASISVISTTTANATLYTEFSVDGSTTSRSIQSSASGTDQGIHSLIAVARYFRVRVTEDSSGSNTPDLQTMYYKVGRIAQPTSRREQSINRFSDVINTRAASDFKLDVARGKLGTTVSDVHKFGYNPDVASATEEDITFTGGTHVWLTAAAPLRIQAGGDANDGVSGTGALTVSIEGLDANFTVISETVTTAGTSASSATSASFIRVTRAYVATVGTYTGANIADMVIETTGPVTLATIPAGRGQTKMATYTVPANTTAYLSQVRAWVDSNKECDIIVYQRQDADDVSSPFTSKRVVHYFPGVAGETELTHDFYTPFPAKTDIWVAAIGPTGGAAVGAEMEFILEEEG